MLLYGPPGTGKTTLARVISNVSQAHFESMSAVLAGVADLRKVIEGARERRRLNRKRTILFVDEVQDLSVVELSVLLGCLASGGAVTLAGDPAQRMVFDTGYRDWPELLGALGQSSVVTMILPPA